MSTYLFAYHGSSIPKTEAEDPELMTAWLDWMDSLGKALEANNNPLLPLEPSTLAVLSATMAGPIQSPD